MPVKATPLYSAFALISIESIWPSVNGDEVPINYPDITALHERLTASAGSAGSRPDMGQVEHKQNEAAAELSKLINDGVIPQSTHVYRLQEPDDPGKGSDYQLERESVTLIPDGSVTSTNIVGIIRGAIDVNESTLSNAEERQELPDDELDPIRQELANLTAALETLGGYTNIREEAAAMEELVIDPEDYGTYPQSEPRPSFTSILGNKTDAHKKRRGYFKILPLNVVSVSTNTSTSGGVLGSTSFDVSFTLDDVIIIADAIASNNIKMSMPRAIPYKIDELEDELIRRFNGTIPGHIAKEIVPYGMTAYRITGNEYTINIEDIVEANDTITIWMYHDPKEFDIVAESPSGSSSLELARGLVKRDFTYVIGTGTRKSQDDFNMSRKSPPRTRAASVLNSSGILREYVSPEEEVEEVQVSLSQSFTFFKEAAESVGLGSNIRTLGAEGRATVRAQTTSAAYGLVPSTEVAQNFSGHLMNIYYPDLSTVAPTEDDELPRVQNTISNIQVVSRFIETSIIDSISKHPENIPNALSYWRENWAGDVIPGISSNEIKLEEVFTESEDFFEFLPVLKTQVEEITQETMRFVRDQNVTNISPAETKPGEGYFPKRTTLSTQSHGETPYLLLKGHVDKLEVSYGAAQGTNLVSLNGRGYEKILTDNVIYYEDLFSPTGGTFPQYVEGNTIYSQMLPPIAMRAIVETYAPRYIYVGKAPAGYKDTLYMTLHLSTWNYTSYLNDETAKPDPQDWINQDEDKIRVDSVITLDQHLPENILKKYFEVHEGDRRWLVRGRAVISINTDANLFQGVDAPRFLTEEEINAVELRIFYPVNYINTTRIEEMIRSMKASYDDIEEALIKIPIKLKSQETIANTVLQANGSQIVNQCFIDESGRFRQRLASEAWERTPRPEYTPTITDHDVLSSGSKFSRDSSRIINMMDIRAQGLDSGHGIVDARFAGRSLNSANDYIPISVMKTGGANENRLFDTDFYGAISEPFFRYGMRYQQVRDLYSTSTKVARRKSILVHQFFDRPIKSSMITVRGNPSYRAGETVLTCLQRYKYRSKEIIDIDRFIEWLSSMRGDEDLKKMYIGVDGRWLENESYYKTANLGSFKQFSSWFGAFKANPHDFVLNSFIRTLIYLKLRGVSSFSPEYFPTTWWAVNGMRQGLVGQASSVYDEIYSTLLGGATTLPDTISENPKVLNLIRMQNFRATSYYIDSVKHNFVHGEACTTSVNLMYGQDNLVLLEPYSLKPIGFISLEKRMKIGYDDTVRRPNGSLVYPTKPDTNTRQVAMWEEFKSKLSEIQKMYKQQYIEDREFKEKQSFLYNASKYRNSSNFMYDVSLDLGIE